MCQSNQEDSAIAYQKRLRALSLRLSDEREMERKQLSEELHDQVGQELGMARLKLSEILKGGEQELSQELEKLLFDVEGHLKQALKNTRNIGYQYCPQVLYDVGLLAALEWLVEYYAEKSGLNITFTSNQTTEVAFLHREFRPRLFTAMRECLYNAFKYAKATTIHLSMEVDADSTLSLEVVDDGLGFDMEVLEHIDLNTGGFGLFSIREMTEYLGGVFACQSSPGHGTSIRLIFPFLSKPRLPL